MFQTYTFDNITETLRVLQPDGLKHYCRDTHTDISAFNKKIVLADTISNPYDVIANCHSLQPDYINPTHRILLELSDGELSAQFLALRSSISKTLKAMSGKITMAADGLSNVAIKVPELTYARLQQIPGTKYLYINIQEASVCYCNAKGKRAFLEYSELPSWEELRAHLPGNYVPLAEDETEFF